MNLGEIQSSGGPSAPEAVPPPVPPPVAPPPPPPPILDNAMAAESVEEPVAAGAPITVTAPQKPANVYNDLDFETEEKPSKEKKEKVKEKKKSVEKTEDDDDEGKKGKKGKGPPKKEWSKKHLYITRGLYVLCFVLFLLSVLGWVFTMLAGLHLLDASVLENMFINMG